jgi:photosystem II stability/assembly factor-like uncharacterized protein
VDHGLSATSVYASAIDPQNRGTIYAATSAGLTKTTDGGANWSPASSRLQPIVRNNPSVRPGSLAIDPQNPSTIYAAFSGPLNGGWLGEQPAAGIFKSTDEGVSWSAANSGLEDGYFFGLLSIDPQNSRTLYAGGVNLVFGGFASALYKSTDAGTNWVQTGSFGNSITALAIDPQHPSTLYISGVWQIFKSTDGGASWNETPVPAELLGDCEECVPVGVLAVDPQNPSTIYAGGSVGVLKSTDGGTSWRAANAGLMGPPSWVGVIALVIDPQNSNTLYATIGGKVFKSIDGAASWNETISGLSAPVNNLAIYKHLRSLTTEPLPSKQNGRLHKMRVSYL